MFASSKAGKLDHVVGKMLADRLFQFLVYDKIVGCVNAACLTRNAIEEAARGL
jgi:hypothetical protein